MNMSTPKLEKGIIEKVMAEIASERKVAHEALVAANRALMDKGNDLNYNDRLVIEELTDATGNMDSVKKRYEGKVSEAEYADFKKAAQARLDEASAAHRAASKAANAELAPLQELAQAAQTRCQELAREWNSQLRAAKAAGLDLKALWTPENPKAGQ